MLVLSRKRGEAVVVGESAAPECPLTITVLSISGATVKLGFEVDASIPIHRSEVWERIINNERANNPPVTPSLPAE